MLSFVHEIRSYRVGLALSGGGVRGLAHIGVLKALANHNIKPHVIAGTSVGSLIGAAFAAGRDWQQIAEMARSVFWPGLLNGPRLEKFCAAHLPEEFAGLNLPFAAIATIVSERKALTIVDGHLPSAISASCAIPGLRRAVEREGVRLLDGGIACVLPALACRELGADYVISSDVWEWSTILRRVGVGPTTASSSRLFPSHYQLAISHTTLLINPSLPVSGYLPGPRAADRMIAAGEEATQRALRHAA
ncbi:MAG TPA: patatin-like phospholipase family protein [Pyrinomonadaceae bacterium]|nr:patatin-like phospholipase family protein [Pyrinomonadaceae bacterium]